MMTGSIAHVTTLLTVLCLLQLSSQTDLLKELLSRYNDLAIKSIESEENGVGDHLLIGAFNVRMFGTTKSNNEEVMSILAKILRRYDLVLVQEIREGSGEAIQKLLDMLNSNGGVYEMAVSQRLGRSYSKEQYAYLYKPARLALMTAEVYPDLQDQFEREPYVAAFKYKDGMFGVIGVHTKPDEAEKEVDALVEVYDHYTQYWGLKDFILMGDFNADCSYVSRSEWSSIRLWTDDRFVWLLDNDKDTTTSGSHCAYDRIVIAGHLMREMINPNDVQVFKYDEEYALSKEKAYDVSDHYPVECKLYLKADEESLKALEKIHFSQSISVENSVGPSFCPLSDVQHQFEACASASGYTAVLDEYNKNQDMYFSVSDISEHSHLNDVFTMLTCISSSTICPNLLSKVSMDLLEMNLQEGAMPKAQEFPEIRLETGAFLLEVKYRIQRSRMPYQIILTRKTEYFEEASED